MKLLLIIPCLVLILSCGFAQSTSSHSKTKEKLLSLNNEWANAITKGDSATLDHLFAEDIIVTSGSGEIRNKKQEIRDAAEPPDPNFSWIHPFATQDVMIRIYKNAAVVAGLAKWTFSYKDKQVNQERRYTHTYAFERGRWKIVAQQISGNLYKA